MPSQAEQAWNSSSPICGRTEASKGKKKPYTNSSKFRVFSNQGNSGSPTRARKKNKKKQKKKKKKRKKTEKPQRPAPTELVQNAHDQKNTNRRVTEGICLGGGSHNRRIEELCYKGERKQQANR